MNFWKKILKRDTPLPKVPDVERTAPEGQRSESIVPPSGAATAATLAGRGVADIFLAPMATEKASMLNAKGQYVFRVSPGVNKPAVARAVAGRYGVGVASVRIAVMPGKARRRGRITGWKPGFKKAIVTLKEGQRIEIQ